MWARKEVAGATQWFGLRCGSATFYWMGNKHALSVDGGCVGIKGSRLDFDE